MIIQENEIAILQKHLGVLTSETINNIIQNVEYYITDKICVFISLHDFFNYASKQNHSHNSYSFFFSLTSDLHNNVVVESKNLKKVKTIKPYFVGFSPGVEHQEITKDSLSKFIAVYIDAQTFEREMAFYDIKKQVVFKGEMVFTDNFLFRLLSRITVEIDGDLPAREKMVHVQLTQIIHLILRQYLSLKSRKEWTFKRVEINRSVGYIYQNISKKIEVKELADIANLSVSHYNKIVKQLTGETPVQIINNIRLEKACNLLKNTNKDLSEIAVDCGYNSLSYFSSIFSKLKRTSPKEYRNTFNK